MLCFKCVSITKGGKSLLLPFHTFFFITEGGEYTNTKIVYVTVAAIFVLFWKPFFIFCSYFSSLMLIIIIFYYLSSLPIFSLLFFFSFEMKYKWMNNLTYCTNIFFWFTSIFSIILQQTSSEEHVLPLYLYQRRCRLVVCYVRYKICTREILFGTLFSTTNNVFFPTTKSLITRNDVRV